MKTQIINRKNEDEGKIDELLDRGVEKVYPSKDILKKVLLSGKKLRLYQGFDPTGTKLHIGHMVGLRKLAQFQKLGHHVIFVIGDGTGQAGDPSGKTKSRHHLQSLTLSTHSDEPGVLRRMLESFGKEGINLESIKSEKVGEDVKFKIKIDEHKYKPELISKVVHSLVSQGFFTNQQLRQNAESYIEQASKILDFKGKNKVEILYNGDWLNKLTLIDILEIAQHFSVQQLIERDMFQERLKTGESINLREFLYPLLQGYDSVAMDVDLELGGTDQTFNMLAGRTLMKGMKNKEKFVMTTPLLSDSRGVKIGKSEGNLIGLTDAPSDLFGKIMSLGDDAIIPIFTLLTDIPTQEIAKFDLKKDAMNLKKRAASLVIEQLHGKTASKEAEEDFSNIFQNKKIPEIIEELRANEKELLSEVLIKNKFLSSKSEWKRLVLGNAVRDLSENKTITDVDFKISGDLTLKIGKKKFIKVLSK